MEGISFSCIFNKAQTTIDGGWIISFQVSQDEADQIMKLASLRDALMQLAVIPINKKNSYNTKKVEDELDNVDLSLQTDE